MNFAPIFLLFSLLFASALSAPFEIRLQRKSAAIGQQSAEIQKWLEKAAEEMENGQMEIGNRPKCPFRNLPGIRNLFAKGKGADSAAEVPISDFVDTFLVGQISVGTPPQQFDVILDSTMFVLYGVPANFLIDVKTCEFGQNLPCEKMRLFDPSQSSTFSKWPSIKNYSLANDVVSFGNAKAEASFLLLNGREFVGPRSFDLIYKSGALNIPRLDGIFSMAFTSFLSPIKSGMEYLLANEESKIATVYIEPLKALDFFAKQGGMVTVGGLDTERCEKSWDWNAVPLLANRWKIPMKSVEYGDFHIDGGEAFFSTFHTFIYGPKKTLAHLLSLVKPIGPIDGKEPKDVAIECDRSNLPDIKFHFGNRKYTLTPEQYVLDVVLDPNDHSKNICHLMIRPIPEDLPDIKALMKPTDWFFGQLFFNQFCVAFDYTAHKQKIGLAAHLN